jgi:hypothetical protein
VIPDEPEYEEIVKEYEEEIFVSEEVQSRHWLT